MADEKQKKQNHEYTGEYDACLGRDEIAIAAKNTINPLKTITAASVGMGITWTIIWLLTKGNNLIFTLENESAEIFAEHPVDARVLQLTTTTRTVKSSAHRSRKAGKDHPSTDTPAAPTARRTERTRRVKWNPIVMTVMGESVAESLGKYWHEYLSERMSSVLHKRDPFPRVKLYNLAMLGKPCISYFICLSDDPKYQYEHCHESNSTPFYQVVEALQVTKPDTVVIHDQSFAQGVKLHTWRDALPTHFAKLLAFNFMLHDVVKKKIDSVFYLTISLSDRRPVKKYFIEMEVMLKVIDMLSCSKNDETSVRVTVVDWAKLTCPRLDAGAKYCNKGEYGFEDLLPDGTHPTGESGKYLSMLLLSLIMGEIAQNHLPLDAGNFSSWDEALQNPISKDLLTLAPKPPGAELGSWSRNLVSSFYLCPNLNVGVLEADFNKRTFAKYTSYQSYSHSHAKR